MALIGQVFFDDAPGVPCSYHFIYSHHQPSGCAVSLRVLSYVDKSFRDKEKALEIQRGWVRGSDKWYTLSQEASTAWWKSGTATASALYALLKAEYPEFAHCVSDEEAAEQSVEQAAK